MAHNPHIDQACKYLYLLEASASIWPESMKTADEVITEVWKIKDAIPEEFGYSVKSLVARLRALKHEDGDRIVDFRSMKTVTEQKNAADGESVRV
jgi:hypothetical protein